MAVNEKNEGPRICQVVEYNNGGTKVPALIHLVNSDGTVNMNYYDGTGAHQVTSVKHDPNLGTSTWRYAEFF